MNMNEILDLEDRRDNIRDQSSHLQTSDKIGKHDTKILGFQDKIDKAEEEIHDLEVIMVDRQEHGQGLTVRRAVTISPVIIELIKLRWDVNKNFRPRFENKVSILLFNTQVLC